jgi:hypothetical protein
VFVDVCDVIPHAEGDVLAI